MIRSFTQRSTLLLLLLLLLSLVVLPPMALAQSREEAVIRTATSVLDEVMAIPARRIPQNLLARAHGVAIIPGVVKGGFVVGIRHGRGVLLVKNDAGAWQPPAFVSITGGSVGWQAGIQSTDVILVFRTRKSVNSLMNGKLTIGVDAAGAAGPVGRQASAATDGRLSAEILSYSRSRGLFAGVSFDGSVLQIDHLAATAFYRGATAGQHLQPAAIPASATQLINRVALHAGAAQVAVTAQAPPPTVTPSEPAAMVRLQLARSWQQLSTLLDQNWASFLAPPAGVLKPGTDVNVEVLTATLQRYATVANNPQYASLSQRPEFVTTHQLLREYVTLMSASASRALVLPPPPSQVPAPSAARY